MIRRIYYPTIVLSDIHLGSEHSRTQKVTRRLGGSLTTLIENEQGEWNIVSYNKEEYETDEVVSSAILYAEVV